MDCLNGRNRKQDERFFSVVSQILTISLPFLLIFFLFFRSIETNQNFGVQLVENQNDNENTQNQQNEQPTDQPKLKGKIQPDFLFKTRFI